MSAALNAPEPTENDRRTGEQGEELDPDALRFFSRSPHPYHRRRSELQLQSSDVGDSLTPDASTPRSLPTPTRYGKRKSSAISENEWTGRKKLPRQSSDSGSEADDEGYTIVRALPAPPIRPRKGLRDTRGSGLDGVSSPLLTPSQVDEDEARLRRQYFKSGKHASREPSPSDEEAMTARKKFIKRRRAEMLRRTTETALLGAIGCAVMGTNLTLESFRWHRELVSYSLVLPGLCLLYTLRLLWRGRARPFFQRIHVPAAFDPATLLYPVFLPVLIALSLPLGLEKTLLPNIILSLAALPPRLVPMGASLHGYSMVHWLIAIIPLIASENTEWPSKLFPPKPYKLKVTPRHVLDPESLATLFALHQALLPPLYHLTTTSLLPAELQLLSVGLINVLLFSESPQMTILSILLWVGGIGLFVFCGHVLKWGVALARVPRWRLKRAGNIIRARQTFLEALTEGLRNRSPSQSSHSQSLSDSEDESRHLNPTISDTLKESLRLDIINISKSFAFSGRENGPMSATEPSMRDNKELGMPRSLSESRKRSNTLPSLDTGKLRLPSPERPKRSRSSTIQYYLSLTPAQATVRKWIYAGYVYFVMLALILGPIRYLISKRALLGEEPFGWAVSYLFSGLPTIRETVHRLGLDWWIPLLSPTVALTSATGVEYLRQAVLGPANTRLLLIGYDLSIIILGLLAVLTLTIVEVDTRRKVFHGMMVLMFLPTIPLDPCFVALALALVLAIFLLLDLIRAAQLPPLSKPLASFLTPYVDGRDLRGPVVVSHIFLLIGCAIPLWLSLAALPRSDSTNSAWPGWEVPTRDVSMVAGVVCVGMGDAAASLVGRRWGRRKWPWAGGKSLEGSAAFAAAVTAGLVVSKMWLRVGGWEDGRVRGNLEGWEGLGLGVGVLGRAGMAAMGASLMEAVLTGGNDNVVVPVVLWLLVRGVGL